MHAVLISEMNGVNILQALDTEILSRVCGIFFYFFFLLTGVFATYTQDRQ